MVGLAEAAGWQFGGPHCGHLVGEFPHEMIDGDRIESYIAPGNTDVMRRTGVTGSWRYTSSTGIRASAGSSSSC